jgi:hypothetical protein
MLMRLKKNFPGGGGGPVPCREVLEGAFSRPARVSLQTATALRAGQLHGMAYSAPGGAGGVLGRARRENGRAMPFQSDSKGSYGWLNRGMSGGESPRWQWGESEDRGQRSEVRVRGSEDRRWGREALGAHQDGGDGAEGIDCAVQPADR